MVKIFPKHYKPLIILSVQTPRKKTRLGSSNDQVIMAEHEPPIGTYELITYPPDNMGYISYFKTGGYYNQKKRNGVLSSGGEKALSPASHSTVAFGSGGLSRFSSRWGRARGGRASTNIKPYQTVSF